MVIQVTDIKFRGRHIPSKRHIHKIMSEHKIMNTHEIHGALKNKGSRLNLSMPTLVNILARSPYYEKLGIERIKKEQSYYNHDIVVWGLIE